MSKALDDLEREKERLERSALKDLLSQCDERQQAGFARIFPMGTEGIEREKIPGAIQLCERTLAIAKSGGQG